MKMPVSPAFFYLKTTNFRRINMDYIQESYGAETILKSGQVIGVPSGREQGNVIEYFESVGLEYPEFAGRCLHRDNV
jgi:hypothetical protein